MCNVDESFPVEKVRAIFDGALQRREAGGNLKGREGRKEGAEKRGKTFEKQHESLSLSLSLISLIVAFVSSNIGARCYFNSLCVR